MYVIRNEFGELLCKSMKPIIDHRAVAVESADEPIKQGIVWVTKSAAGEIVDICDHYPLNPEAQPVSQNDSELVAYWAVVARRGSQHGRDTSAELDALKTALIGKGVLSNLDLPEPPKQSLKINL